MLFRSIMPAVAKAKVGNTSAKKGPKRKLKKKVVKTAKKPAPVVFTIDCTNPVNDGILDPSSFEKFLHDKVKVNGKPGVVDNAVKIRRNGSKIIVTARPPFSKRYLKYLTKKFLKKNQIRDWLRVVASDKTTYELRYFDIHEDDEDDDDENDE